MIALERRLPLIARWLACPPPLRRPWTYQWQSDEWQETIAYLEARTLALEAYQALVVEAAAGPLPEQATARLRRLYIRSAATVGYLATELERVAVALAAAGVQPVLLKGLHLGKLLWPDPALRPFADLDLWVEPAEVPACHAVLQALGYAGGPPDPSAPLDPLYHELPTYTRPGSLPVCIDLHYRLAPAYLPVPDERAIKSRCRPWQGPLQVLTGEDLAIYLFGHAARHLVIERRPELLFAGAYRYLGELARLVHCCGGEWHWPELARRLAACEHRRALLLPLRLADRLWGLNLPAEMSGLWHGDAVGELVVRTLIARLDRPWQDWQQWLVSFASYALPDYLQRLPDRLNRRPAPGPPGAEEP